ncbi:MAG: rRNA maturation RNase YbeY [Gammaproteobacteria bacterium RIFCSPHIGHO2_12_FULL_45_9]|nr:MAG: rRNA maturation RNase YbeY [Gammaproteobacteria bacterium RIFCSPHIGHO2_12_FULL_45_9]
MWLTLTLQNPHHYRRIPAKRSFHQWILHTLQYIGTHTDRTVTIARPSHITLRITDDAEIAELNQTYRHKSGPTNILSFPHEAIPGFEADTLGDLVISAPRVAEEAQNHPLRAHWAHLTIHGTLHLLGYDHETEQDAHIMEPLETMLMTQLGFEDPYAQ